MRISDWSSDVCSSDLSLGRHDDRQWGAPEAFDRRHRQGRHRRRREPGGRHALPVPDRTGRTISAGDRNADGRRGGNSLPRRRVRAQLMKGRKMKLKVALLAMVAFGGAATAVYAADRLEPTCVSALLKARLPKTQVSATETGEASRRERVCQ